MKLDELSFGASYHLTEIAEPPSGIASGTIRTIEVVYTGDGDFVQLHCVKSKATRQTEEAVKAVKAVRT